MYTRECPCVQYHKICLKFMQGVRFLGDNTFHKDKVNSKPDKILRMCSSLAIVLCLRHSKSRWLRSPYWSPIFTPVELTRNDISCCDVMLPSAAYRISNLSLLISFTTCETEFFFRSEVSIRDFKRTTTTTATKRSETNFSMN